MNRKSLARVNIRSKMFSPSWCANNSRFLSLIFDTKTDLNSETALQITNVMQTKIEASSVFVTTIVYDLQHSILRILQTYFERASYI